MIVRSPRKPILTSEKQAGPETECRQHSLGKENDIGLWQTEVVVVAEKRDGVDMVGRAGHDRPRNRNVVRASSRFDRFREELTQRTLPYRRHTDPPFRTLMPETRALSTRDGHRSHLAGLNPLPFIRYSGGIERPLVIVAAGYTHSEA